MGMFDDVNVEVPCPNCGRLVSGFQSKDGECLLNVIDPDEVNNFYSSCQNCKFWVHYRREPKNSNIKTCRDKPFTLNEIENMGFKLVDNEKNS